MPLYKYKCLKCGKLAEELRCMKDRNDERLCTCGKEMERDYTIGRSNQPANCERISTALGVHVSQIESGEVFQVHPGSRWTPDGYLICENRAEHKRRLKERGWRNFDDYS